MSLTSRAVHSSPAAKQLSNLDLVGPAPAAHHPRTTSIPRAASRRLRIGRWPLVVRFFPDVLDPRTINMINDWYATCDHEKTIFSSHLAGRISTEALLERRRGERGGVEKARKVGRGGAHGRVCTVLVHRKFCGWIHVDGPNGRSSGVLQSCACPVSFYSLSRVPAERLDSSSIRFLTVNRIGFRATIHVLL